MIGERQNLGNLDGIMYITKKKNKYCVMTESYDNKENAR